MKKAHEPHDIAKYFFQCLMQNQCHICWGLFSDRTQKEFINWTMRDIYEQHREAATTAKLGPPEIKLMFETNNLDLIIRFWRRFFRESRAQNFASYAYFDTIDNNGKTATVESKLIYDNGKEERINLMMLKERNGWRLAYLESGLPF